jgi:glycosyltransferase involved in cell wall biosynthesis
MRILQVVNGYPPADRGGVENITRWLAKELAHKHSVSIFCREPDPTRPDGTERNDELDGISVRRVVNNFSQIAGLADYYSNPTIEQLFAKYVRSWGPDVIHFQHAAGLSATLIEWTLRNKIPYVLSIHDYWYICPTVNLLRPDGSLCKGPRYSNCLECVFGAPFTPPKAVYQTARRVLPLNVRMQTLSLMSRMATVNPSNWRVYPFVRQALPLPLRMLALRTLVLLSGRRRLAAKLDVVPLPSPPVVRADYMLHLLRSSPYLIVPSQFVKDLHVHHGVPADQLRVIGHGLELQRWAGFTRLPRPMDAGVRFGYIGSLLRHKGVDVIIRAFRQVPHNSAATLRIYGFAGPSDPYERRLKDLAAGDARIRFMGAYANEELPSIMNEIDLLLIPAMSHETFSIVAREAILGQVGVLASRMGALPEALDDGHTGYLVPRGDLAQWTTRMDQLAADPAKINLMQRAQAKKSVKSVQIFANEISSIYEEAVRSNSRRRTCS